MFSRKKMLASKAKNPCKVCSKDVDPNEGLQCQKRCKKWAHYTCLNYPIDKIMLIKSGKVSFNPTSVRKETHLKPPKKKYFYDQRDRICCQSKSEVEFFERRRPSALKSGNKRPQHKKMVALSYSSSALNDSDTIMSKMAIRPSVSESKVKKNQYNQISILRTLDSMCTTIKQLFTQIKELLDESANDTNLTAEKKERNKKGKRKKMKKEHLKLRDGMST